jgi:vitamin B12 transporter
MTRSIITAFLALLAGGLSIQAQVNPVTLEGLVVTASPTPRAADAVATHVTVLDGADLRAQGVKRLDEALRDVPGLTVVQNGPMGSVTSVFMRGGESDYVLVLVDGVQVNQPGGGFDFSGLTLANIERIEVVRGPASALFGSDAVAGVVHVITRMGRGGPEASVSALGGSYGRMDWSAAVTGGGDRGGYSLSLDHISTDGILPLNNAHRNTGLSGSFRFQPDDATTARISVRITDRVYHFPTDGSGQVADENSFTFTDATIASFSLDRRVSEVVDVHVLLGLSGSDGGTDDAPDGPADTLGYFGFTSLDHLRRANADVRANARFGREVVTVGWEVEEEKQRSFTESLSQFGASSGNSEYGRWNRAYYGHLTGDRGPVAYNVGGRLEHNERFGTLVTWQAGAVAGIPGTRSTRLRASAGQGIKEPTFFENYATGFASGNADLDPERALSWEAGLDQTLAGGRVVLRGTYFHQSYRDLIQYTFVPPTPGGPNFLNVAAADAQGWEILGEARVGRLEWTASATFLRTEVTDAGVDEGPGAAFVEGGSLLRRPNREFALSLSYDMGDGGRLSVGARTVGARDDRDFSTWPAQPVQLPRYTTLHLGGEVRVVEAAGRRPGFSITFRGENLTGAMYEEVLGFRAPGRAFYLGGRVETGSVR